MIYNPKIRIILSLLIVLVASSAYAQQTVVKGKVIDAESNDGVPFVNVSFQGTSAGGATNFEGYFEISISQPVDSIEVSCLGYLPRAKAVKEGETQYINFQLIPSIHNLEEIVIVPGENPAFKILRKIQQYRDINNMKSLSAYQVENYNRVQVSIDNMSDKFRNRKMFKSISNMFDSLQVIAGEDGQAVLPIFVSETVSNYYFRKNPEAKLEEIMATKVTGVGVENYQWLSQFVGSSFQVFNFYDNWVSILGKNFISPVSGTGKAHYRYYLVDSVMIDDHFCYEMVVAPKREQDLAFWGTIWVEDSTYAILQLDLEIKKQSNLNWIEKIKIQQEFERTTAGPWLAVKTRALIDMVEVAKQPGFISKFYLSSKNIVVNQPKDIKFYQSGISVDPEAYLKDDKFWEENRHDTLTSTEKEVYHMIDSVKNLPTVRTLVDVIEFIVYGYQPVGKFDLGPYIFLYNNNSIEGHRFRLGFITNQKFSTNLILRGYLAYGTKDRRGKYNAQLEYIFSRKPWTKIGLQYRDDIDQISVTDNFFAKNNLFQFTAGFTSSDRLNNSLEYRIWGERMLFNGFNQIVMFHNKTFKPLGENFKFGYYPDLTDKTRVDSKFSTSEITLESRYSARERYVYTHLYRISISSHSRPPPVFTLRYQLGIKGLFGSDFQYNKLMFNVKQTLKFGVLGKSNYSITTGKIFETLPWPLLKVHKGNETIVSDPDAFYLMNFFEFVSDEWISLFFEHHFDGLFMNRIPLMKKLRLRTLIMTNMVYGRLKAENNVQIDDQGNDVTIVDDNGVVISESFSTLASEPYIEVGAGIENILNLIRLDAVFRLNYNDQKYLDVYPRQVHNFGLKISFQFRF